MNDEIYNHAIRLLARREYSTSRLKYRLERRFQTAPGSIIDRLTEKRYLDDKRFAETYVRNRKSMGKHRVGYLLKQNGVDESIIDQVLEEVEWPSLGHVLVARMEQLEIHPPLSVREASRLYRVLERLGYEGEAITEELERLL